MFKYTPNNLKKIEELYKASGYLVRYGQGNFKSGYCILEDKNVIVVNKFFTVDTKISCLLDLFEEVEVDHNKLPTNLLDFYQKVVAIVNEKKASSN